MALAATFVWPAKAASSLQPVLQNAALLRPLQMHTSSGRYSTAVLPLNEPSEPSATVESLKLAATWHTLCASNFEEPLPNPSAFRSILYKGEGNNSQCLKRCASKCRISASSCCQLLERQTDFLKQPAAANPSLDGRGRKQLWKEACLLLLACGTAARC